MDTHKELWRYCHWNKLERIEEILDAYRDLDLTYDEGTCFMFAFLNENPEMLTKLLEYYSETKLQTDRNSGEYKLAKYKLVSILQNAVSYYSPIAEEMQTIISPYMPQEESSSDQDLEGFDEMIILNSSDAQDLGKDCKNP